MFKKEKNLKDAQRDTSSVPSTYQAINFGSMSYTKTNKLITALYMVTDIIDKDEPLRNKLRTLGTEIISDINFIPANVSRKISEIMSFLDIASAVNIISEMNCNILKKEFAELDQSIKELVGEIKPLNRQINLSQFFQEPARNASSIADAGGEFSTIQGHYKGHQYPTRIGVQKGSTLMKALVDKINNKQSVESSDVLKKQRRIDIINIIKIIGGNATIKDIKDRAREASDKNSSIISCSEKTLQRELVSMVKDSVLNKTGEKRWSKYFLK